VRRIQKSLLWCQILADVLSVELVTVDTTEGGAYGAALLAGVGVGTWSDVASACKACVKIAGCTLPDLEQVDVYQKSYRLYPALEFSFA